MEALTREEWQGYLHKIETCDYPLPASLIGEYNDWRNRSIVGRMLFILKDVEGAMRVLSTVRSIEPDLKDAPEYGLSEAEHKTLCLRDLGEIVWLLTGQAGAALPYFEQAYSLCQAYKHSFRSANRGRIWLRCLEMKAAAGRREEAEAEARTRLAEAEPAGQGPEWAAGPAVAPYRFYACVYLAGLAAAQGGYAEACQLLEQAYAYFPTSQAAEKAVAAALACSDLRQRYEALRHCTEIQYVPWEKLPVPDVDEVRRRQYQRYLARERAKAEAAGEEGGEKGEGSAGSQTAKIEK